MTRPQSPDTDLATEQRMFAHYRRMSVEEKLNHIGALGHLVEEVAMAGVRARYPAGTERENRLRLVSRWLDRETMIRVYGWDPDIEGQ